MAGTARTPKADRLRLVISGGGSGGHVYPALAIAEATQRLEPGLHVVYVGTDRGLERDLATRAGLPFRSIHARGILGKGLSAKAHGVWSALRGVIEALSLLGKLHPQVVVGTGGYVTGPVGLAAALLRIPLVLQEQNAWPGITNRWLSRYARMVFVPYEEARPYLAAKVETVILGNPVRPIPKIRDRFGARERLGIPRDSVVLMATGGSQGAETINRLMLGLIPHLEAHPRWVVLWATGTRYFEATSAALKELRCDKNRVKVSNYFYEIADAYQAADVYLGRAGAMTMAECTGWGLPSILVPSPYVSEDHQTKNAMVLAERGAAVVVKDRRGEPDPINWSKLTCDAGRNMKGSVYSSGNPLEDGWSAIHRLMEHPEIRERMGQAASSLYEDHSADRMATAILRVMRNAPPR